MRPNAVNIYNAIESPFLPYHRSMAINDHMLSSMPNSQSRESYCLKRSAAGILGFILHSYVPSEQLLHIIYDQHRFGYLLDKKASFDIPAISLLENAMNEKISHHLRLDTMRISSHEAFLLFHRVPVKVTRIASWNLQSISCLHLLFIHDFFDIIDGICISDASSLSRVHLEEIRDIPDSSFLMILGSFNGL